MILEKEGYAYDDLTLVPRVISNIKSRSECDVYTNGNLPIFTAPMASVVSDKNYNEFKKNGIMPIIPRNININIRKEMMEYSWIALSLKEFEELFISKSHEIKPNKTYHICVDIANGHMKYLYDICAIAKDYAMKNNYILVIMTGNIANPGTYEWLCKFNLNNSYKVIDYIRIGIGGGKGCITTSNVSIHYPQATLIDMCYRQKKYYLKYTNKDVCPKIIADGGIRNYDHVIKALALGADYVMIGSLFAQCIESTGEKYDGTNTKFDVNDYKSLRIENGRVFGYYNEDGMKKKILEFEEKKNTGYYRKYVPLETLALREEAAVEYMDNLYENDYLNLSKEQYLGQCTVKFFGMASKDGQISISGEKTKTAEGITKYLPIEFTLSGWVENMVSYLRSAMSYCDCFDLKEFIGNQDLIPNSISEINTVNK